MTQKSIVKLLFLVNGFKNSRCAQSRKVPYYTIYASKNLASPSVKSCIRPCVGYSINRCLVTTEVRLWQVKLTQA